MLCVLQACEDLVNVIVLREPQSHTLSLMKEILKLYEWYSGGQGVAWQFPANDLSAWRHIAPAAVDNFTLRWLLGRTAFCVPVEGLNDVHLHFGKLKLLSMDVILLLGNDRLNTQVQLSQHVKLRCKHASHLCLMQTYKVFFTHGM